MKSRSSGLEICAVLTLQDLLTLLFNYDCSFPATGCLFDCLSSYNSVLAQTKSIENFPLRIRLRIHDEITSILVTRPPRK